MESSYHLIEVTDPKTADEFLILPVKLYRNDKNWIRPLDKDIQNVFDRKYNKFFRHGDLIRWILKDDKNNTLGRIASFYDTKTANNNTQPTGAIGFFECINDQQAANKLFDAARDWLKAQGMEAMDGPINFGDRDRWWGLLVDGFYPPNYGNNYNFPYYQKLFENYGFRNYYEQYTFYRKINKEGVDPMIEEKANRIFNNPDYHFEHLTKKNIEKYAEDFRHIYNKAWVKHSGVKPISRAHARLLINNMKPILDEKLMWFAYCQDEPAAFFLALPELNQIFRHLNGKLNLIGKIKVMYHKWAKTVTKAFGIIFGVIPEQQGKGLEGAIIMAFGDIALRKDFQYKELELNWIGDFNPTMIKLARQIGGKIRRTHVTYRYLFNTDQEFQRAKKI